MHHLHQELAPISAAAWSEINDEAERSLRHFFAARKLVDVLGPLGFDASSINVGHTGKSAKVAGGSVVAAPRLVQPIVELSRTFDLARDELDSVDRGARDADLAPLVDACRELARVEDTAVFGGLSTGGIKGMADSSPHRTIKLTKDFERYPNHVAKAISVLKEAGVGGPYAIALGPACYAGVIESTDKGGYPLLRHLGMILGGPVVWAPAVDGAIVMSERGGDFELTIGEDTSIAYVSHTADKVTLQLRETMAFQALSPEAAVALVY